MGDRDVSLFRFLEGHRLAPHLLHLEIDTVVSPLISGGIVSLLSLLQLQHHASQIRSTFTEFEKLWVAKDRPPSMISILYKLLAAAKLNVKPFFVRKWECDLQCEFTDEQLHRLYHLTQSSVDSNAAYT